MMEDWNYWKCVPLAIFLHFVIDTIEIIPFLNFTPLVMKVMNQNAIMWNLIAT